MSTLENGFRSGILELKTVLNPIEIEASLLNIKSRQEYERGENKQKTQDLAIQKCDGI